MQAFVLNRPTGTGSGNPNVSVLKYDLVTEVLDWGRTGPWKDVPTSDKGVIFEDHFVRAVRQLRLDAFGNVRVCTPHVGMESDCDVFTRSSDVPRAMVRRTSGNVSMRMPRV